MLYHRFFAGPGNADNVEPRVPLVQLVLVQKKLRRPNHLALFARLHRFERRAEAMVGAGLHFDEDDHFAVEHDQIHLAGLAAIVALDQLVALFSEKSLGDFFAFLSQPFPKETHGFSPDSQTPTILRESLR